MSAVLIAEPEADVRGFLVRHLADDGFDVFGTDDGTAALELAARSRPDLVLLGDASALDGFADVPVIVIGPEQADAAIDQDPFISQNFSWWNRRGTEVIRGHTTLLPIGREVLYVEPIFLRSQQNHLPQMKKVVVVMRGKPFMADTLDAAVHAAVAWHQGPEAAAARAEGENGSRQTR